MALHEIERIRMPEKDVFLREYVFKRRPVIITDLFADEPIRQVQDMSDAERAFGHVKLRIQPEYASAFVAQSHREQVMTFSEYWRFMRNEPNAKLLCTEYEVPARIMTMYTLPSLCEADDMLDAEILNLPRTSGHHDLLSNMFLANAGNCAHLHYDGDHRQVILYQVFGRKEVLLFQPDKGHLLKLLEGRPGFSGVFLEHMSEQEKREFVDRLDGYRAMLYPGEAIYMPMLIWHFLDYTDDALSINVRFGRNRFGRFFCVDNFHRDYYIQNFASKLADRERCETRYKDLIDEAIAEYIKPAADIRAKASAVRATFRSLCARMNDGTALEDYCGPEQEAAELDKVVADIGPTMRYATPAVAARMRHTGPMTPAQKRQIEETTSARGYGPGVLAHLLRNRLGKSTLAALTKAEAAQFMMYMRSPGSSW